MLNSAVVGEKSENGVFCRAIIDTTDIYKVPEGQEDSDYISGEAPTRRRKMSFSRTMTYSSEASSPTKQRQLLFPPSVSLTPPPAAVRPQTSQGAKLTSHVFTSYVCPSPTGDLLVPGQESPSRPDFGSRRRSWSMPPSPTTATLPSGDSPAAQTPSPSPRLPLTRAHSSSTIPRTSTPHTTSSKPDDLPVQLESETKMVVKLFSASATRSVIDLIRRDLTEEDRHCLKKWKIVKVEFNPELPVEDKDMPSQEEPKHNEVKVVQWNDGPKKEEPQGEEDWELPPAVPPDVVGSWDAWETVATDVFGGDNAGDIYTSDESFPDDTSTAGSSYSHELDGLTHHNEPPPWFEDGKTGGALKSLRTELIYPLVDVDTALSIDKGKQREQDPAQADLDSFLTANKTFENNDKGVLKMDWRSYAGSREKVGRWMQERRRLVLEHNEAVAVLVATGVPNERIPKRKELPTWEEWLAQVEKQEEDPSGGDVGMQEKVPVGIVVYRPAGRDEEEVFVEVFEEEVFEEEKPAMVMGPEEVQEHAMSMMQMEMPLPQGVSALRRGSMVGVMGIGAVPGDALGTSPGRGGAFGHWTGFGSTG
ncbi:hypothetical protein BDZ91DRAFT_789625 [Kalaharituber pfeilii]|nr:hypothetical protein BDZ91DRAFT_789625 [Kalaharituber pfeilii]